MFQLTTEETQNKAVSKYTFTFFYHSERNEESERIHVMNYVGVYLFCIKSFGSAIILHFIELFSYIFVV